MRILALLLLSALVFGCSSDGATRHDVLDGGDAADLDMDDWVIKKLPVGEPAKRNREVEEER